MSVKANASRKFLMWLGLIALICTGVALWFAYDGFFTYPQQRERARAYEDLVNEDRLDEWPALAEQRGWPTEDPGKPKKEAEILFQKVIAAMAIPPGLLYAFFFLTARRRWIEMHENGLRTSSGRSLEFDQIILLDKNKWKAKGIAKVKYQHNSKRRTLVLDDWKFDPEPTGKMLREIESYLDDDQIVGGLREPPLEDQPAEPQADGERESL